MHQNQLALAILKKVDAESPQPIPKFQVNIKIELHTALLPDYLSISYDYANTFEVYLTTNRAFLID